MNEQDRLDAGIPEQGRGSSRMPILCILEMDTRQKRRRNVFIPSSTLLALCKHVHIRVPVILKLYKLFCTQFQCLSLCSL